MQEIRLGSLSTPGVIVAPLCHLLMNKPLDKALDRALDRALLQALDKALEWALDRALDDPPGLAAIGLAATTAVVGGHQKKVLQLLRMPGRLGLIPRSFQGCLDPCLMLDPGMLGVPRLNTMAMTMRTIPLVTSQMTPSSPATLRQTRATRHAKIMGMLTKMYSLVRIAVVDENGERKLCLPIPLHFARSVSEPQEH